MTIEALSNIQETDQRPLPSLSEEDYVYEELPSDGDFIRLLDIFPGDWPRVRLRCVRLTPETSYEALSYTWGATHNDCKIECCDNVISIGRNLYGALSRLQLHDQIRVVWADALCINQHDHEERAQQVRLMHKIYEYADCVVVDFGSDEENLAANAFRMIRETLDYYNPYMLGQADQYPFEFRPEDGPEASKEKDYLISRVYASQEWWQRAWVQQEIGLAKAAVVHWGSEKLPWSDLVGFEVVQVTVAYDGPQIPTFVRHLGQAHTDYLVWASFSHTKSWRDDKTYLQRSPPPIYAPDVHATVVAREAMHLLEHSRSLKVSDPKDHLYAFMGHPAMKRFLMFDTEGLVVVDYSISPEQLFSRLAKVFISATGTLDILSAVQHRDKTNLTPSWVPQWTHRSGSLLMTLSTHCYGSSFLQLCDASRRKDRGIRSGATSRAEPPSILPCGQVLEASGLSVDRIIYTTNSRGLEEFIADPTSRKDSFVSYNPLEEFWRGIVPRLHEGSSPYSDYLKAFANTLSAGKSFDGESLDSAWELEFRHFRSFVEQRCNFQPDELLELFGASPSRSGDWTRLAVQMQHVYDRRLFVTATGYMGVSTPDIEVGDEVCVLFDASVPFVLHPISGSTESSESMRYQLSGECYVYGLMHGEAIGMWEAGKLPTKRFKIV